MVVTTYGSCRIKVQNHFGKNDNNQAMSLVKRVGDSGCTTESDSESDEDRSTPELSGGSWRWWEYVASWRFVELMICVIPVVVMGVYYEFSKIQPRLRPIPFQHVYTHEQTTIDPLIEEVNRNEYESYTNTVFNLANNEKHIGETISHKLYIFLTGFCPWIIQLVLAWCLNPLSRRIESSESHRWDVMHRTTCMYFVGIGLTDVIINCVKYYVGYLRPMFLEVCQPHYDGTQDTFRCKDEEDWSTLYGRTSFPSNHAGWAFCGMMLLSMYLERNFGHSSIREKGFHCFVCERDPYRKCRETQRDKMNMAGFYRLVSLLCYSPMLFAIFVASSRVVDNKHFPADIVCGGVLGGSIASLVFSIWFPP